MISLVFVLALSADPPSSDTTLRWTFRQRFSVGGADDQRIALSRVFPQDVATDGNGRLYLHDRSESRILVLDGRGRVIRSLGRKGGGPGELQFASAIGASPTGELWVADAGKRAIIRFDSAGSILPEIPTRELGLVQRLRPVSAEASFVSATRADSVGLGRLTVLGYTPLRGASLPPKLPVDWSSCGLMGHATEPLFSPRFAWASNGRVTVYSEGRESAIILLDHQGRTRRHARPGRPTPSTIDAVRAYLGDSITILVGQRPCAIAIERVVAEAGMAPTIPPYDGMLVAPDDMVWAIRNEPRGRVAAADIYSANGGYVGTVTLGKERPVAFLSGGELVTLGTDDSDVPMIVVYEVLRR